MDAKEIIELISKSKKSTKTTLIIKGNLSKVNFEDVRYFGNDNFGIVIGEWACVSSLLEKYHNYITDYEIEMKSRNSAIPLADLSEYNARIEPGAIIRKGVEIGKGCIIMMGAVINIGAQIGEMTMIDMNVVVGGRAVIGKNCHIGAGAVIAGVIEPPSSIPVDIGDNVLIGANAVILEGIKIEKGSVIAAGAVVIDDIPQNVVAAGIPARIIKEVDQRTKEKSQIVNALRNL